MLQLHWTQHIGPAWISICITFTLVTNSSVDSSCFSSWFAQSILFSKWRCRFSDPCILLHLVEQWAVHWPFGWYCCYHVWSHCNGDHSVCFVLSSTGLCPCSCSPVLALPSQQQQLLAQNQLFTQMLLFQFIYFPYWHLWIRFLHCIFCTNLQVKLCNHLDREAIACMG